MDDKKKPERDYRQDFFETTGVTDFMLKNCGRPPRGYPSSPRADRYSDRPFAPSYDGRRKAFIRHCLKNPAGRGIKGYYLELVRLHAGKGPVHAGMITGALEYIDSRRDCADFVLLGIMRMLYQFPKSPLLPGRVREAAERTVLEFKYWPDEPGIDSMCTWTENHQIMFSCNEYLAGQLFTDRVFANSGQTGFEKMVRSRARIMRWLDLRYRTGFSEWLSHVYYDEDITALVNLVDFCRDPLIARGSAIVLDLIFLDMALNSLRGAFGSTHGRSYTAEKKSALVESTTDTSKLLFGTGIFSGRDNMSAVTLALSDNYRLPRVIFEIANDIRRAEMINRQRMGIRVREAGRWGLDLKDPDDVMVLLSLEAYAHPRTFGRVMDLFDCFRWWENSFFGMFKKRKRLIGVLRATGLWRVLARVFEKDMTRNTREEVNVYTYRTPDCMLSSAQDYRRGFGGDQQHIWQATLSPTAVCFTTHPGHAGDSSGGYWVGSGTLPRVGQVGNVLVACYRASRMPGIYMTNRLFFTHAYFPRREFDEVHEAAGWVFGRLREGYVALYSRNGYRWQVQGVEADSEIIAEGRDNIWICETGRRAKWGSFDGFMAAVRDAEIGVRGGRIRYMSPSQGAVEFGWRGPLLHNGSRVRQNGYPRFDNHYVSAPFPPGAITVTFNGHRLDLDLSRGVRGMSGTV
jgi:hypothetical protein